jgi:hypothetical protein
MSNRNRLGCGHKCETEERTKRIIVWKNEMNDGSAINVCGTQRQRKEVNNIEWPGDLRSGCNSRVEKLGWDEELDVKHVMLVVSTDI